MKKIIFNDSFFFVGEDYYFGKITPTNSTLKITVNVKIDSFQTMQLIISEKEVVAVQDQKIKNQISVKGCKELSREKRFYTDFDVNF